MLLVRNRIEDFDVWKPLFDAEAERGAAAGLVLVNMWRDVEDANNVFFLMSVEDKSRAMAFMSDPQSMEMGEKSGVIDGEAHFVEACI